MLVRRSIPGGRGAQLLDGALRPGGEAMGGQLESEVGQVSECGQLPEQSAVLRLPVLKHGYSPVPS